MTKPKKELKGMLFIFLGLFFSIFGMISLSIWTEHAVVAVIFSFIGVLIILYGLYRIIKANSRHGKV